MDLEQYFEAKGTLHCTTKFCNYGKAEGAKEYAENPVRNLSLKFFFPPIDFYFLRNWWLHMFMGMLLRLMSKQCYFFDYIKVNLIILISLFLLFRLLKIPTVLCSSCH